jgi:hypothetical protein
MNDELAPSCPECGAADWKIVEPNYTLQWWVPTFHGTPDSWEVSTDTEDFGDAECVGDVEREILDKFGVEITPEIEAKLTKRFMCRHCTAMFDEPKLKVDV